MSRSPRSLAMVLAALSAIGPFAIDTYLPAFPAIAAELGATKVQVQQSLTIYLGFFALMTLWHGALADALGRRRVVLWSLVMFFLTSVGCALATQIEHLWIARALQGMCAGAGMVVGRAIVRDLFDGAHAQRLMSTIQLLFALAPAAAPIIGGWVFALSGWRAVFWFLAAYSALMWVVCLVRLPETLDPDHRRSLHPVKLARDYAHMYAHPALQALVLAVSMNFAGFFLYVMSAPTFLMEHLGVSPQGFAWLFGPTVAGMMTGSWLARRLAGKLAPQRQLKIAYTIMLAAALINVVMNLLVPASLPWAVLPVALYNIGQALAMPILSLLALELFPRARGMVSSCQAFVQSLTNTAAAGLVVPLLWGEPLHLAAGMAAFVVTGWLAWLRYRALHPDRAAA
ncbi:Drug resistance transporter Bcr/CflA subfamily [Methyloversatilis universalis FAM5]|uniref:Bcr/CflA family efflux transporter n=1 Tax=Methyloversatilis universalis (strain ATCC BAA-1314 / DSM 25237 / JCM 13912 / CCUG 52030 / FAM5) TaxID=1000565 RepID=F5RG81_METUF|nr:multidrug effflux MFS transporter [Methyloversatilis universalis]EGK70569.1 Drug resistance transporter Bcr/CflA subfamily [Methyloversatilis universalis FAM5]